MILSYYAELKSDLKMQMLDLGLLMTAGVGAFLLLAAMAVQSWIAALLGIGLIIFSVLMSRRVKSKRKALQSVSAAEAPGEARPRFQEPMSKGGQLFTWIKIVFPPLLLLPLFKIPVDMITAVFWGAGAIAFIVSVVHVLAWGGNKLYFMARGKGEEYRLGRKLVRPLMVLIIFPLPVYTTLASRSAVEDYIKQSAAEVQKGCVEKGKCPEGIEEWANPLHTKYAKYGRAHHIVYKPDGTAFEIYTRFDIDNVFTARGGVNKELSFVRISDGFERPTND